MNRAHLFGLDTPEPRSGVPDSIAAKIQRGSILGGLINLLPLDRLRRFRKAFRVEIHNDVRTGRATFKAEIGANTIEELANKLVGRQMSAGGRPAPEATSRCQIERNTPYPVSPKRS
jgi:hypothetical protein